MSDDESIETIQRRMQSIRRDLGCEVVELVAHAREMTDWRNYVRAYPWLCVAAAAAAGYFIVPKGTHRVRLNQTDLASIAQVARAAPEAAVASPVMRQVGQSISKAVTTAAVRGVVAYLGNRFAKAVTTQDGQDPFRSAMD